MTRTKTSVKLAKITFWQVIIVAVIGALASIATVFIENRLSPKPDQNDLKELENKFHISDGIPIGTIISSSLTFEQLCENFKQPKPSSFSDSNIEKYRWIPADGRKVPGSEYSKITNSTKVIDLRGVFLRGRNKFDPREDDEVPLSQKDPDPIGLRNIGHLQKDAIHGSINVYHATIYSTPSASTFSYALINRNINQGQTKIKIGDKKNNETRPNNIAINYFVKIN